MAESNPEISEKPPPIIIIIIIIIIITVYSGFFLHFTLLFLTFMFLLYIGKGQSQKTTWSWLSCGIPAIFYVNITANYDRFLLQCILTILNPSIVNDPFFAILLHPIVQVLLGLNIHVTLRLSFPLSFIIQVLHIV